MKKIFFAITLYLFSYYSNSQSDSIPSINPYYDARTLSTYIENGKFKYKDENGAWYKEDIAKYLSLLKFYFPDLKTEDFENFVNKVKDSTNSNYNPFFDSLFESSQKMTGGGNSANEGSFPVSNKGNPFIGGPNVTNIIRGIGLFMIDRAKKELTAAFFNRLKTYFDKTPEIRALFPKTSEALQDLLSYHYPEMLPTLRTNFHEDLKLLPIHLDDVVILPKYQKLLANFPEIQIAIRTIRLVSTLENEGLHPADIIKRFSEFPEWKDKSKPVMFQNFGNAIRLSAILSESLRFENTTRAWVSSKEILDLLKDEATFKIYLGLVYQKIKIEDIKFYRGDSSIVSPLGFLKNNPTTIFQFQNYVSEFIDIAEKLDVKIKGIQNLKKEGQKPSIEDWHEYIGLAINIIEYGTNVTKLFDSNFVPKEYISLARNSNGLFKNIFQENYSAGVSNLVSILETTTSLREIDLNKKINKSSGSKKTKRESPEIKSLDSLIGTIEFIRKYGLFIANMVEAKTPEEVQSVIEAAVLPVGSSSIKKHSDFNVSIQSYLGASYNFSFKNNPANAWDGKVNVTAPIGVSFSHGFNKSGSISLFASLIDIGAVVDYEIKRDTTFTSSINTSTQDTTMVATINSKNDYKVELGQIFSPGLFLVYGAPWDMPLSLMVGCQYGPGLISISNESTDIVKPSLRWMVSLTVDIPWFTLSNTDKKKFRNNNN